MISEPSEEELAAASAAMKARMTKFLLHRTDAIDARTMTVLQRAHVMREAEPVESADIGADVITDASHPHRMSAPIGPFLFLKAEGQNQRIVVDVASLLFSSETERRKAALDYFLKELPTPILTERNSTAMREAETRLLSSKRDEWQLVAISLFDTLKSDWFLNLSGVRQCIEMRFDEGYSDCLLKVLRPSLSALEKLAPPFWNVAEECSALEEKLGQMLATASDLGEALHQYIERYGFLPLAGTLSMSAVVQWWLAEKSGPENPWDYLWNWAADVGTPVARYHVCETFVALTRLIPSGAHATLWQEIAAVTHVTLQGEPRYPTTEAWRMRSELARHYLHYLEARIPGQQGERLATLAWWLTEQLARLFGTSNDVLMKVRQSAISREYMNSSSLWQLVVPPIQPSALRYATLFASSVWSLSLQALLARTLTDLKPDSIDASNREQIEDALSASALFFFPPENQDIAETFGFSSGVMRTIAGWPTSSNTERAEFFAGMVEMRRKIAEENTAELLDRLGNGNDAEDVVICQQLRVQAYLGLAPSEEVWQRLNDPSWRASKVHRCRETALQLFLDSLFQLVVLGEEKWRTHVPHFLAMAAEAVSADESRRQMFFAGTLISSLAGDTASAIERLVSGEKRHRFIEDVKYWRAQIDDLGFEDSGWASAKLRAVRSALYLR